jgi:hypothetical protein
MATKNVAQLVRNRDQLLGRGCEIAPNFDPIAKNSVALIFFVNLPSRWGRDWPRRITPAMSIF